MTNKQIADLANSIGFNAYFKMGGVYIFLRNRKVGILEVETALGLSDGLVFHCANGVIIHGIDS